MWLRSRFHGADELEYEAHENVSTRSLHSSQMRINNVQRMMSSVFKRRQINETTRCMLFKKIVSKQYSNKTRLVLVPFVPNIDV